MAWSILHYSWPLSPECVSEASAPLLKKIFGTFGNSAPSVNFVMGQTTCDINSGYLESNKLE